MVITLDIKRYVDELEIYADRKLNYPIEVGELLQIIMQEGLTREFEELIFQAKFLVKTQGILKRIGSGTDGFEKLSAEYQSGIKKSISLLHVIVEKAPSEVAQKLTDTFLIIETDSLNRVLKLFSDLRWIKNWDIDGKPLPFKSGQEVKLIYHNSTSAKERGEEISAPLIRIQKSILSCAILFILFLFIDPPVTILGWILSVGIAVFLLYIGIQVHTLNSHPKS